MTQEEINKKREAAGLQPMSNQNRVGLYDNIKQQAEEKQGNIFTRYGSRLFDNVKSQFSKAKESVTRGAELIEEGETTKGLIRGSLGPAAAASQAIFSPLTEAITPALTKGFEKTSEGIDKVSDNSVIQRIATSPVISKSLDAIFGVTGKAMKWVKDNPDDATILMDAIEVAGSAYGVKKVKPKLQAVKEAAIETADSTRKAATQVLKGVGEIADEAIDTLPKTAKELAQKVTSKLEAPKPTASQAVKQVLQGQTDDFASGVKAISNLDTVGIKTSKELVTRIDETISSLAQKVDTDLATDTTKKMLQDRMVASAAGNIVEKNPIIKALNQLDEMYTKIGDTVESGNIKNILKEATESGLTAKEINDIARVYGREFGSKAFNKMGDPLTSVNAKLFENTRKAIKDLAREGITGNEAKLADEAMSSLYNFKTLVSKNVEAVNKLQQKIQERGLLEKIGYKATKYIDVLSGRSVRGLVGGLLPRGVGNKTMNALDLEDVLQRNLSIIQDAIKSGSDNEIVNILKKIDIKDVTKKADFKVPAVGKTVSKVDDLASQAKKYKSADEFVKAQLDKNSYITKEPIKLYRGEGKGIGNTTFVKGKYYTDSKDMAKQFGKVTESELPAGTKVFDFDNIKNNFKQNIIPQELLVDDEKLTQYLILNGYNVTKNTTARGGIEYVLLKDKYAELGRLRKQFKTDIKFGEYITGEGYELNKELLGRNEIGDLDIAKRIMKSKYFKNNQLTDIWNQANKK